MYMTDPIHIATPDGYYGHQEAFTYKCPSATSQKIFLSYSILFSLSSFLVNKKTEKIGRKNGKQDRGK